MANKVKYNIHDVYYAPKSSSGYGTPVAIPGAVSLSLEAQGDRNVFYADGIEYFVSSSNNGYEGDLEIAYLDDEARQAILGEILTDKVLYEKIVTASPVFALGFAIDGNETATKFWFYNCTCQRPAVAAQTNEATVTPQTETISIKTSPELYTVNSVEEAYIRAKCSDSTATNYATWFTAVQEPA